MFNYYPRPPRCSEFNSDSESLKSEIQASQNFVPDSHFMKTISEEHQPYISEEVFQQLLRVFTPLIPQLPTLDLLTLMAARYQDVRHVVKEHNLVWEFTKEGSPDIYAVEVIHSFLEFEGRTVESTLGPTVRPILERVDLVYSEIETPRYDPDLKINRYRGQHGDCAITAVEYELGRLALAYGKIPLGLETQAIRELLAPPIEMDALSLAKVLEWRAQFSDAGNEAEQARITNIYLQQVLEGPADIYVQTRCDARTKLWMQTILNNAQKGLTCVYFAGGYHFDGRYGIPNLLHHEGYVGRPLLKSCPPSPSPEPDYVPRVMRS